MALQVPLVDRVPPDRKVKDQQALQAPKALQVIKVSKALLVLRVSQELLLHLVLLALLALRVQLEDQVQLVLLGRVEEQVLLVPPVLQDQMVQLVQLVWELREEQVPLAVLDQPEQQVCQ
jgi:hypothetical protein